MFRRESAYVVLAAFLLLISAPAQAEPAQSGIILGAAGSLLLLNGSGDATVDDETWDFDVTNDLLSMDEDADPGLGWGNKMLFGPRFLAGYRISPMISVIASYQMLLKKKADDSMTMSFGDLYEGTVSQETEYSQKVLQLLARVYPVSGSGLFLVGGVEQASFTLEDTWTYSFEGGSETESEKDDGSAIGVVGGVGFEGPLAESISFFGSATFSITKFDDKLFDDDVNLSVGIGGFTAQAGVTYLIPLQ